VEDLPAVLLRGDESGFSHDPQVSRHRRLRRVGAHGQFGCGDGLPDEVTAQLPASWFGKDEETLAQFRL